MIHISVDGLRSSMMQAVIDAGDAPNFQRLQDEGAWTGNARTDFLFTTTLPNHTTMLTGRPVSQVAGLPITVHHGYTSNVDPEPDDTLHNAGNPALNYVASVFDVVHDAGLSTALYAAKDKFVIYDQSYNVTNGAPHANGSDKIDRYFAYDRLTPPYSLNSHVQFVSEMSANHYRYTLVHYADPDDAGHSFGWGSPQWQAAVTDVDDYLADVFELVETDPMLAGRTTILLTSDHGGTGTDHIAASDPANFTIPFFAWGAGVARGDLYAMNPAVRMDPAASRPGYGLADQPIRNGDTGNMALYLLGLDAVPGSFINAAQDLRLATAGDYNFDSVVDAGDYVAWRNSLGASGIGLPADGDGDRTIGVGDYAVWKAHYGESSFSPGVGGISSPGAGNSPKADFPAVPEQKSLLLLAVGGILLAVAARGGGHFARV